MYIKYLDIHYCFYVLMAAAFNLYSEPGGLGSIFQTADDTESCICPMLRSLSGDLSKKAIRKLQSSSLQNHWF